MNAQHTPTPWNICPKECGAIGVASMDSGTFRKPREAVAITGHGNTREGWHYVAAMNDHAESEADAAFIVRACNSHDALVAALKTAKSELAAYANTPEDECVGGHFRQINAALAAAGEDA